MVFVREKGKIFRVDVKGIIRYIVLNINMFYLCVIFVLILYYFFVSKMLLDSMLSLNFGILINLY